MSNIIVIVQIISATVLGIAILLQGGGSGLGSTWGGGGIGGGSFRSRRGAERFLLYATIVFAAIFFISSLASFLI